MTHAGFERLVSALAMVIGWEALIVLQELRGLTPGEQAEVSTWAARAHPGRSAGPGGDATGAHAAGEPSLRASAVTVTGLAPCPRPGQHAGQLGKKICLPRFVHKPVDGCGWLVQNCVQPVHNRGETVDTKDGLSSL